MSSDETVAGSQSSANSNTPVVFVVDDDPSMCRSLRRLLRASGLESRSFSSAQEFLAAEFPDRPSCLLLDVQMPGMTGLELQDQLRRLSRNIPIVFITGHGDVPMAARAMKAGAVDFLEKPFDQKDLLEAVRHALERGRAATAERIEREAVQRRVDTLTPREYQVLELVVAGLLNKQIADRLGTVEKTIKVHRSRMMMKMQAASVPDLVRLAQRVGIAAAGASHQ
jgi:FixJ family two-component response regulator